MIDAEKQFPDAAQELRAWFKLVSNAHWRTFLELRQVFPDADAVDDYVVFNIRQNRYRLITIIHFARERDGRLTQRHIYIRSFLTHRQYDHRANWDKEVKP